MEGEISNQPDPYACDDILFEILSWMPTKAVIKYSPLLYNTLLSQPHFIVKKSINSSSFNGGLFVQSSYLSTSYDNLSFHVLPSENPTAFGIPNNSIVFLNKRCHILTSSQGILVIHDMQNNRISLCKPVSKTLAPISYPGNVNNILQFCTDGFKIRFLPGNLNFPDDYAFIASVFVEIKDDPWKSGPHLVVYSKGKWFEDTCDLRGKPGEVRHHHLVGLFSSPNNRLLIHYLYDSLPNTLRNLVYLEPYIRAYDIETMTLWMKVNLPPGAWLRDGDHQLLDIFNWGIGEPLGLVRTNRRRFTVWVLEKYTPVRWRKVVEKKVSEMGVPEEEGDVVLCSVVDGTGLLFTTSNKVYSYEMMGANAGRFDVVRNHGLNDQEYGWWKVEFVMYVNTLRPVHGDKCSMLV